MKKYILSILLICNMTFAYSATSTTNDIYVLAQANSTSELSSVPDVNTTDSNGDTALCLAIKNKNTSAYNALKNAGADTNPKCIKSIPKDSYNSFMKTVADTGTTSKTFLGLGKWGWGLIGLGVAGGVGVAAMSGGGGGSDFVDNFTNCEEYDAFAASFGYKYSERGKCPDGYKDGGGQICQSYTCGCRYTCDPIVCGEDFWFECPTGFVPTGNTCKSGEITYKQCEPDTCDGYDYDTCPDGWLSESSCWSGFFTLKYKCDVPATCSFPYTETECTEGYIEYDTCKSGNTVYKQCILDREHYISQGDKIYPKLNCEHGTQVTNSCVCKEGWTGELCDTPVECPYNTQSCGTGYIETVYRCKSGDNTYVKCELDKKHYIEQDGVIYRKLDCQSGVQDKDTCICPDGMTGALCDKPVQCPYTTTACSYGYVESGNTCQSVNTIYKECIFDSANYIEQGGNIYPKLNCVHGSQEAHKCICENGWAGVSCNNPVDCPYTTVSCSAGFHETGHSCQSGETTYMECEPDSCDGYNYTDTSQCPNGYKVSDSCLSGNTTKYKCETPNACTGYNYIDASQCPAGYTIGSSCLSGTTTKYMCDNPVDCPYTTVSCSAGFHETGHSCQSGETTYMECEPDSCDGYNYTDTSQCPNGYKVSDSCLSGNTTKYKCETPNACSYNTIECTGGYQETGNTCQSGEILYKECEQIQCGVHATWSETGCSCENGYQNYTSGLGCYPISCGVNATQVGTECYCNPGHTNWTAGYGCYQKLNCGVNATQVANECVCNSGYQDWSEGYGCYETRDCGINATQSGANCVCNPGYQEWTDGYGCYQTMNCGANATQRGNICYCNEGYKDWVLGVGCSLTELECGVNAVQNGTHCECLSGYDNWQEGIGCSLYGILAKDMSNHIVNNSTITLNNNTEAPVYGIKFTNMTYNYYAYNTKIELSGTAIVGESSTRITSDSVSGTITIQNTGNSDVYGIKSTNRAYNAYSKSYAVNDQSLGTQTAYAPKSVRATANSEINITNTGDGNIYGLYGEMDMNAYSFADSVNSCLKDSQSQANGYIYINNIGDGNICGMCSGGNNAFASGKMSNVVSTHESGAKGYINITNIGDGVVSGMEGSMLNNAESNTNNTANYKAYGYITISNHGNGNVYGMKGTNSVSNAYSDKDTGEITITNDGLGHVYGMYSSSTSSIKNSGSVDTYIKIYSKNNGKSYGMYNGYTGTIINGSEITIQNLSNGDAVGIYTNGGTVTNSGTININNIGTGTAIGILGDNNSNITNTGSINMTRDEYTLSETTYTPTSELGASVFGIYAKSGSVVNNSGTINITSNGNMFGIYAESGATVTNTGTITLNGISCNSSNCSGNSNYIPYIVLNGSTLYNSGVVQAQTLNLNSMGGNVVAGLGSQFVVENAMSGDLNISSDIVSDGNQTTYVAENIINAGDTSSLNVRSASAMFNASLADNGHDVVMTMRDFSELTDNKSLATFLANNYANGNNQAFFNTLKSMDSMTSFNSALGGLAGLNTFTQFAHEDISALREISLSMNNQLFENSDRDKFDISGSMGYFSFSNSHNSGSGQYGISSDKISDNWKLGYGMAMANINTGDNNGMSRQNKMWMFYMPATYTNDDYELVIAPKAGFTNSDYSRRGYNNMNYEGHIEKRIFGLMNDLRYPIVRGNWTFAPDVAFNTIVYSQAGHEDDREFSLVIPDDQTVSVETGIGLYTKYDRTFSGGSRLKLSSGLMAYREFGDTYDIKLGIRGMDGTFTLYNNDYKYRGAASIGFDYNSGLMRFYGNAQYFMDNDNYMNFKGGISYRF